MRIRAALVLPLLASIASLSQTSRANDGPAPAPAAVPYTVIASTEAGKAISLQKDGATSIEAALDSTLPDLAHYFGAKPVVGAAYQDAKDPKSGGATFSVVSNGQPMKGIISCKLNDTRASVAVIYARANTSKADWDKLMTPAQASAPSTPAKPAFNLKEFDFPDGTGSLELADGWTTPCGTCINPVVIKGPAQENIVLNNMLPVETPDSPNQQRQRQMQQQSQQMTQMLANNARAQGRTYTPPKLPPSPFPPPLVAPYLEPVEALKALIPQFSKQSEFNHGPTTTLDAIVSVKDAPPVLPNGKGAIIVYDYTQTQNGQQTQFRRSIYVTTAQANQGTWRWCVTGAAAPKATFAQDAPLMFAMLNSLKVNQAQFTQNLNAQTQSNIHNSEVLGQAENQVLATQAQMGRDNLNTQNAIAQQQHDAQMEGYHEHNAQWAADETQKQRNAADFIETIQGTRTIYDTQTGASGQANLSDVTGVVNSLNEAALDPNRFVQVPLRDYLYAPTPVPTR